MRLRALLAAALATSFLTGLTTPAASAGSPQPRPQAHKKVSSKRPHFAKATRGGPHERGIASWFRTKHALSVAHRTLPFGTKIKISTASGRSVIVTVVDRGPFLTGRVVDLSSDAFKKLASLRTGLVQVTVEVVL